MSVLRLLLTLTLLINVSKRFLCEPSSLCFKGRIFFISLKTLTINLLTNVTVTSFLYLQIVVYFHILTVNVTFSPLTCIKINLDQLNKYRILRFDLNMSVQLERQSSRSTDSIVSNFEWFEMHTS